MSLHDTWEETALANYRNLEAENSTLIRQAQEHEILMEGMAEEIRDLKAEIERLKKLLSLPLSSTKKSWCGWCGKNVTYL